jgi:hypothetical protein
LWCSAPRFIFVTQLGIFGIQLRQPCFGYFQVEQAKNRLKRPFANLANFGRFCSFLYGFCRSVQFHPKCPVSIEVSGFN